MCIGHVPLFYNLPEPEGAGTVKNLLFSTQGFEEDPSRTWKGSPEAKDFTT